MFLIRYWFYGDNDETPILTNHPIRKRHYDSDDEEYYNNSRHDAWENHEENENADFFAELERVHAFKLGELMEFYNAVRDSYRNEIDSDRLKTIVQLILLYVDNFLGYLIPPMDDPSIQINEKPEIRAYPPLIYVKRDEMTMNGYCRSLDNECTTFMIDRRLDFIYAYTIEKAIIDVLKKKARQYRRRDASLDSLLTEIDRLEESYRTRLNFRYINRPSPFSSGAIHDITPETQANAWLIYTRRSSSFFKNCMKILQNNEYHLSYNDKALSIEPIPFQQVLLLCGNCPGFIEKYRIESNEQTFNVSIKNADDWITVPIWFSLFNQSESSHVINI